MARYVHRPWQVDVVGWTGKNFDEVKEFVHKHFGPDCDPRQYTQRAPDGKGPTQVFEFSTRERSFTIRAGSVLVIHRDKNMDRKIEILPSTVFQRSYMKGASDE